MSLSFSSSKGDESVSFNGNTYFPLPKTEACIGILNIPICSFLGISTVHEEAV